MTTAAPAATDRSNGPAERVSAALGELAAGRPVVVLDDAAALVFAAERATPSLVASAIGHTTGVLGVALPAGRADELALPPADRDGAACSVTVDARTGVDSGMSAADRARTIAVLAAAGTTAGDLVRPGNVVPLRARPGGVLARRGRAEAAADLAALAGLRPAGGVGGLVSGADPTRMADGGEGRAFAQEHGLVALSVDDVAAHRLRTERLVERCAEARLPLQGGTFRAIGYRSLLDGREHVALVRGTPPQGGPVHVERECALSIVATSACDCRTGLDAALDDVARCGDGIVVLLRGGSALGACAAGGDERSDAVAAGILTDLGVSA